MPPNCNTAYGAMLPLMVHHHTENGPVTSTSQPIHQPARSLTL